MLDGRESEEGFCRAQPTLSGFSLVQVWSDSVSNRERTPAASPETDTSASVYGMAGRREGAGSELSKSFGCF